MTIRYIVDIFFLSVCKAKKTETKSYSITVSMYGNHLLAGVEPRLERRDAPPLVLVKQPHVDARSSQGPDEYPAPVASDVSQVALAVDLKEGKGNEKKTRPWCHISTTHGKSHGTVVTIITLVVTKNRKSVILIS